jgi:hypothetical protein
VVASIGVGTLLVMSVLLVLSTVLPDINVGVALIILMTVLAVTLEVGEVVVLLNRGPLAHAASRVFGTA